MTSLTVINLYIKENDVSVINLFIKENDKSHGY